MAELVETYADLPLGAIDASVVALAERLGLTTVATLDRRHFTVVRPKHVEPREHIVRTDAGAWELPHHFG